MIRKFPGHDTEHPPGTVTLADYVAKVQEQEKRKLTFDEWVTQNEAWFMSFAGYDEYGASVYSLMEYSWKAGQENI